MTTHLWLVIDHTPGEYRRPPELVVCDRNTRPNEIVSVPLMYAENRYIGEADGSAIYPWTMTDRNIHDAFEMPTPEQDEVDLMMLEEQEREERRKRGAE